MRWPHRGARHGTRGTPPRAQGDGRKHDGHEPRHGTGLRARPVVRRRRPGRPDFPAPGPGAGRALLRRPDRVRCGRLGQPARRLMSSRFQRFFLPGLAFKAVVIGGGYATGRELAEFFIASGPWGGVKAMALGMLIWSAICVTTFLFSRASGARDYSSFVRALLGPGWIAFE